jgi:hypothetical protein
MDTETDNQDLRQRIFTGLSTIVMNITVGILKVRDSQPDLREKMMPNDKNHSKEPEEGYVWAEPHELIQRGFKWLQGDTFKNSLNTNDDPTYVDYVRVPYLYIRPKGMSPIKHKVEKVETPLRTKS